jgi:transmembrane sensor
MRFAASFIVVLAASFLIFHMADQPEPKTSEITTVQKQTLPGQKSSITLRDGTVVWLNSGSVISYQSDFNDSLRIIHLTGQAFFEVFKDETKPFIVRCMDLEIEALGTSFDVNGYEILSSR